MLTNGREPMPIFLMPPDAVQLPLPIDDESTEQLRALAEDDRAWVAARVRQRRLAVLLAVGIAASGLVLTARVLGW